MCKLSKSLLWLVVAAVSVQAVTAQAANKQNNGGGAAVRSKPIQGQVGQGTLGAGNRIRNNAPGNIGNQTPINLPNGNGGGSGFTKRVKPQIGNQINPAIIGNPILSGIPIKKPTNPGPFPPINPNPNPGNPNPGNPNPGPGNPNPGHPHHGHHHHFPWHHLAWRWAYPCPTPCYHTCGTVCVNGQWIACSEPVAVSEVTLVTLSNESLVEIPVGATFRLPLTNLNSDAGAALIQLRGMTLPVEVLDWAADSIVVKLPAMGLNEKTETELTILDSQGDLIRSSKFLMVPASTVISK